MGNCPGGCNKPKTSSVRIKQSNGKPVTATKTFNGKKFTVKR